MRSSIFPVLLGMLFTAPALVGQQVVLDASEYAGSKAAGTLPPNAALAPVTVAEGDAHVLGGDPSRGGGGNLCECWIEPDGSYNTLAANDDGSSSLINLPFQFNLYGDLYNTVYVNNNGNVSFVQAFATYSASGFPNNTHRMVAPFWADVDTRGNGGQVRYKVTPTAMYVNWVGVGYYNQQTDKRNWFQLIITNGSDPLVGVDKNVSFCYKDMQWTTGSASQGVNGFGGVPATVGANRGQGTGDYIQFGRFDQPGMAYDGPFGANDGVDWLDDKNFVFTTAVSTQNIPPIASGQYICDTLRACVGQVSQIDLTFIAPESNQTVVSTSFAPTLASWTEVNNTSGIFSTIAGQFVATSADVGFHTVTFQGTDNGTPNLTSTVNIIVEVLNVPSDPLVISGNTFMCGQPITLTATPGYGSYDWSNGATGASITINQPGTYTVSSNNGLCSFTSPPFTVNEAPTVSITGPTEYCGSPLPELTATPGFDTYSWSNGASGGTIQAAAGTYTVTVSYQGCVATSAPFTLVENDPGPPVITGNPEYCEGESTMLSVNGAPYDTFQWSTGVSTPSITATAGTYTVSASYLNCTYTSVPFVVSEIILPPLAITGDDGHCPSGQATISASPGFDTYTWNNNVTGQTIQVSAGTYFVTASIGACTAFSNTFTVTILPSPTPVITGPNYSCAGQPVVLTTTEPYATYQWSNGVQTATNAVGTGSYTVTVTTVDGCTGSSAPFNVLVGSTPTAGIHTDPASPQNPGTTVQFTDASNGNGSQIVDWQWWLGENNAWSTQPDPSHTYNVPGTYEITLVVTTTEGCVDSVMITYVIRPADVIIPNVFSPNSDGVNDALVFENVQYYKNTLSVFNRWGQEVFAANNYTNSWRASGVPDGTYFFVLRLNEDGREFTGHLTILR